MPVAASTLPPPVRIDHVTAVLLVPVTMLENVVVCPSCTVTDAGETVTTTGGGGGGNRVTVAVANAVGLATDVARNVTVGLAGN